MALKKTTFTPQSQVTPQRPVGVDTSGIQITPDITKGQQKTTFTPTPSSAPTTYDITHPKTPPVNIQDGLNYADSAIKASQTIGNPTPGVTNINPTNPQESFYKATHGQIEQSTQPVQNNGTNTEKTITENPDGTTTVTKQTPNTTPISSISDFKKAGGGVNNLESLIRNRPEYAGIETQIQGDKVTGSINGKKYEWSIDAQGNPVKTESTNPVDVAHNNIVAKYLNADADTLYNAYVNGDISSAVESSIASNPNVAIAKERYRKKVSSDITNNQAKNAYDIISGKDTTKTDKLQNNSDKVVNDLKNQGKTDQEIKDYGSFLTQDEELNTMTKEMNSKNLKIHQLQDAIDNNVKEIIKQYPGITKGSAMLLSARQSEGAIDEIKALSYEVANLGANINYKEGLKRYEYDYLMKQKDQQNSKDLADYNRQQNYLYTNGDLNSTNPTLQNIALDKAVNELYTRYPIPGMESSAIKLQKVKDLIAQGKTPQEALSQIEGEIRNSGRYKDYLASEKNKGAGYTEFGNNLYKKDSQGNLSLAITGPKKYTKLDDGTYQDEQGNIVTKSEIDQQKLLNNSFLNAPVGTNVGVECGTYARNSVGMSSVPGGNNLEDRIKSFSDKSPVIGSMVLFTGGNYDKTYGHISVVTGINPQDGTMKVKESNLNGNNTVTERTIKLDNPNISGYYNNTPLAGGTGTDNNGVLSTILGSGKFTKEQTTQITNAINNGEDPITVIKNQAKQLLTSANQTQLESYEQSKTSLLDLQSYLKDYYAKGGDTGIFTGNIEKTINKLGEVDNPDLVDIATQIQAALQIYRHAVSGTAYSAQEGTDIASIFPGINKSQGLNEAILKGRLRAFDSAINGTYEDVLGKKAWANIQKTQQQDAQNQPTQDGQPTTNGKTENDIFDSIYNQ